MYHGIINVYKEAGYTSHDVVARLRGICKQKKIGHTGTLDPDAVGVLPVCLGNGTKLCDMLTDSSKEYVALLRLGLVTDTQDISGKVLKENEVKVSQEEAEKVILSFLGDSMQVPPMYSALKVNGKKLYELARQGQEVERAARPIRIYKLEILQREHPEYRIKVVCSKGTYIRTLCHDMGRRLGCGGVMVSLQRTRVGKFEIDKAYTLDALEQMAKEGELSGAIIPVERMFEELPAFAVKEEAFGKLQNGNQLMREDILFDLLEKEGEDAGWPEGKKFRVYSHRNVFFGIYRYDDKRGLFSAVKMFLT
ncbi:tRNA pseudouridine(55) synthase TruB [Parablautia muri]|uniref:tRNA pseudouridine synthase B n=1 Tax=Parablautia muri TaxID=2320879 RepID=A0A9X5BCZ2_9FIRM|nr:tRNA pseudouridine(55) synthase TruB [Parablautia muri]NBJ91714.1 tRNA pseudouridine(55) synthase TruB [Parablautia muri]